MTFLTPEKVETIETYIWSVQDALGLAQWRVYLSAKPARRGCNATIDPVDGRRIAMLSVARDWYDTRDSESKRIDITHELLHLHHHDVDEGMRRFFRENGDIGEYVKSVVLSDFKTRLEQMVDTMSYVIAPTMPPWGGPRLPTRGLVV